jgi:hypothetical protein
MLMEEEEEEFIQNRARAGARFLTRWDQHAVAHFFFLQTQRRPEREGTRDSERKKRGLMKIVPGVGSGAAVLRESVPSK